MTTEEVFLLLRLSNEVRSAGIFYLVFLCLMLAVTIIPAHDIPAASVRHEPEPASIELLAVTELFRQQCQEFKNKSIEDKFVVSQIEQLQLQQKKVFSKKQQLEWVKFSIKLILPVAASEEELLDLVNQWCQLSEKLGLEVQRVQQTYQDEQLGVRVKSTLATDFAETEVVLEIAELTLIQPLAKSENSLIGKGIVPQPRLKLKTPIKNIPPSLGTEPKEPADKLDLPKPKTPVIPRQAQVAIIIDDVGYVRTPADNMLKVPADLTWAIMPFSPYGQEYQAAAIEQGFEIMLHLPLEPFNEAEDPGPGKIKREWTTEQILEQLALDLEFVSEAKGVNNHMGSAATADRRLMEILLGELKKRGLFFIDSYTSNQSIAEQVASEYRLPFAKRQVFIDHEDNYEAKKQALRRLIKLAVKEGEAIGIGHVRNGTAEAIVEILPEFVAAGVEIVPVSELVNDTQE